MDAWFFFYDKSRAERFRKALENAGVKAKMEEVFMPDGKYAFEVVADNKDKVVFWHVLNETMKL